MLRFSFSPAYLYQGDYYEWVLIQVSVIDLIISDLQIPFHHPKALEHAKYLKRHHKIPDDRVFCVGDETDQLFGGMWKKNPNETHSAISELQSSVLYLKEWYAAFPQMKLAISNHGTRWLRKATEAEIPSQMLRRYEEVIQAPDRWMWKKHWLIERKYPYIVEHGDHHGGQLPHLQAAMANGISTIIGHHHTIAGVEYFKTNGMDVWGACSGSLIDFEQLAFEYARNAKKKPQIGCSIIVNNGRIPIWVPLD